MTNLLRTVHPSYRNRQEKSPCQNSKAFTFIYLARFRGGLILKVRIFVTFRNNSA